MWHSHLSMQEEINYLVTFQNKEASIKQWTSNIIIIIIVVDDKRRSTSITQQSSHYVYIGAYHKSLDTD